APLAHEFADGSGGWFGRRGEAVAQHVEDPPGDVVPQIGGQAVLAGGGGQLSEPANERAHALTAASGRIGDPVPPVMRSGASRKVNSRTPASATSSRLRCSMMKIPDSTSSTRCTGNTACPAPAGICS